MNRKTSVTRRESNDTEPNLNDTYADYERYMDERLGIKDKAAHQRTVWQRITKINEALVGSNAMMLIIVVALLGVWGWYQFAEPEPKQASRGIISRETSERLKERGLISTETEDSFLEQCRDYTLPKVGKDYDRMARTCGCEFESIALIALNRNQEFTDVLADITSGKMSDQRCEYVD